MSRANISLQYGTKLIRVFVLLRAPNSLCLKEPMHEKAGRTYPSPHSKSENSGYSKEARSQRLDTILEPPKTLSLTKNITRERTRPQLMERLNVP